ncbi:MULTISPECIES: EAL domain-containing protein [unclassified Pseudoalteromonas]|uniref:EAL domain-containing protein n=1 Tax=unclassified Pseudoalteromonas TaxID=194690 RepID=UPI001F2592F5|nr:MULTISPECIES: EAL domain-containing protein [unclassified Pseudoalteromonas]MDP2633395.1 EAL domain-containing protein [Pseudoalteromonas sp. 1_MG-2023]
MSFQLMGGFILKVILRLWLVCAFMVPLSNVRAENLLTHVIDGQIFADHSAVMLVIEPRTGDIVFANESAADFYGYSISQLQAMKIQQINIFTEQQVAQERQAALNKGQNYFVFKHQLASGETRTVSVYSAPFELDNKRLLFSVIHDISSQRALEKELWHYQENLEELVASQTKEIEKKRTYQFILSVISIVLLMVLLAILTVLATRLRSAKRTAQKDSATLKAIFNGIDDLLIFTDTEHTILDANTMAAQKLSNEDELKGKNIYTFVDNVSAIGQLDNECQFSGTKGTFWGEANVTAVMDEADHKIGEIHLIRDITQKLKIRQQQRLASTVFSTTNEGILVSDSLNKIQAINSAFTQITGYQESDVLGETPAILSSGRHKPSFFKALYANLKESGHWEGEVWNRRKDGSIYPCWLNISVVFDEEKQIEMYVALFNDISSRKESEQEMWLQINFDNLTGLANRYYYNNKLDQEMIRASTEKTRLAICFIDLDRFKNVNDTLGHNSGDVLLLEAANRLKACMHSTDLVARLGGDEFALLLSGRNNLVDIERVAKKSLQALSSAFKIGEHEVFVSGSMGITIYPDDGVERKILLRNADSAMYKAKEQGRNCFEFFTRGMHEQATARSRVENALHKALCNNEFTVYYQPIISNDRKTIGCEALLRWQNPELGNVSPAEFIPICEDLGLIVPIGEWVLREACREAAKWCSQFNGQFFVTVNFSSVQFVRQDIAKLVSDVLEECQLSADCLTLEITETLLAENSANILQQLQAIRNLGVGLAIDDFGTGYSSLSYLKRFPLSKLKIDREFIKDLPDDNEDCAMVSAIISMASNLHLEVVAEGVETEEQRVYLSALNCDYIQGFLYSKPLPMNEFDNYLKNLNPGG